MQTRVLPTQKVMHDKIANDVDIEDVDDIDKVDDRNEDANPDHDQKVRHGA